uniref:Envelope protein n=1 Tax=Cairina moschata TaxID=8855 RepID=A0A8C3BRE4_CAIMO
MGLSHSYWYLGVLAVISSCIATQHHPHQPFHWNLIRWDDSITLQQITMAGAPSFKTDLCNITTVRPCNNQSDFYLCPASNPGRSYCNYPNEYFCAKWGCETIALKWKPGAGRDKYLTVQFGPKGCKYYNNNGHEMLPIDYKENCTFLWMNVTNPMDQGWFLGKTWGVRYYEPDRDRGGLILIKKEKPKTSKIIGPNKEYLGLPNLLQCFLISRQSYPFPHCFLAFMWKVINASFQVLNQTNPEITEGCWLCVSVKPPYYEAIGDMGRSEYSNESNPSKCSWGQEIGITLTQVMGKGRCIGTVPRDKNDLCHATEKMDQTHKWLIPANNTRWVCSLLGVTPCLSLKLFSTSHDFCVQVVIIPRILYHTEEYMYTHHTVAEYHLVKREPITAVTLVTLMAFGAAGAGTGIVSLIKQSQEFTSLRIAIDEDLACIEQSIKALEKSVRSLSEVLLQNRRGLDLIFLQQGGLCAALREECCIYADRTGVVRDTMTKLREGLEKRKRENEARQNCYESWFNYSPWLTTLLSTIAGPLLLLILALTFGPCIFNRVIAIVKSRLEAAHLMLLCCQARKKCRREKRYERFSNAYHYYICVYL